MEVRGQTTFLIVILRIARNIKSNEELKNRNSNTKKPEEAAYSNIPVPSDWTQRGCFFVSFLFFFL